MNHSNHMLSIHLTWKINSKSWMLILHNNYMNKCCVGKYEKFLKSFVLRVRGCATMLTGAGLAEGGT